MLVVGGGSFAIKNDRPRYNDLGRSITVCYNIVKDLVPINALPSFPEARIKLILVGSLSNLHRPFTAKYIYGVAGRVADQVPDVAIIIAVLGLPSNLVGS